MGSPPLIKAKATILERGSVGIETVMTGPEYHNKLRDEVQQLPNFHFPLLKPLFRLLSPSDVAHSPNKLDAATGMMQGTGSPHVDMLRVRHLGISRRPSCSKSAPVL